MIRKEGNKFVLRSKKNPHKVLGRAKTKAAIQKRERQVEFFKHNPQYKRT